MIFNFILKILQLIKTGIDSGISSPGTRSTDEWGEFNHISDKKFFSFEEIRDEIIAETDSKTGGSKSKGDYVLIVNFNT